MASTLVFPPHFRVTDSSGNPVSGAQIRFFEAGTSTPKLVYSDAALSNSLGSVVYTRSDGLPVASEGSSTVVLVYTGEDPYKLDILRSDDSTLYGPHDNIIGAPTLDPGDPEAPFVEVVTTGSNVTLATADRGKLYNCQSNTVTFPTAVSLGDGWFVYVKNGHTSGRVTLSIASGLSWQGASVTAAYLEPGQCLGIACDGSAYRVFTDAALYTPANFRPNTPGVIVIADRITAEPSTSVGSRYIVSTGYGSFSTHDIVTEVASGVFVGTTPPADCGWLAYVQDEDLYLAFIGSAWITVPVYVPGLGADTNPDGTNDLVGVYDLSGGDHKKVPLYLLPGSIIAIIEDNQSQNTAAGTLTADTDNVRVLNTLVYNRDTLVSLASNRFTLPAGTWEIAWLAPVGSVAGAEVAVPHQSFLYNFTDSAEVKRGTPGRVDTAENETVVTAPSVGSAVTTITASKAFEIRHRPGGANILGGERANLGTEVYARVIVRRA